MRLGRGLLNHRAAWPSAWLAAWLAVNIGVDAVRADTAKEKPKVAFSWDGKFFLDELPHGREFLIELAIPQGLTFKSAHIWRPDGKCDEPPAQMRELPFTRADESEAAAGTSGSSEAKTSTASGAEPQNSQSGKASASAAGKTELLINVPLLKYATGYCFRFTATEGLDADEIAAVGRAAEALVQAISDRQLFQPEQRRQFLDRELGKLGKEALVVDDETTTVLDWVADWTETEDRFVALWQQYGDRERAAGQVAKNADRVRTLDLEGLDDIRSLFAGAMTAELTGLQRASAGLRRQIENGGFHRSATTHVDRTARPPVLTSAASALRDSARALRDSADRARVQVCALRARPSSSMKDLDREIDRLRREIAILERQLANLSPRALKRSANEQKKARLEAARSDLVERRTDRLCKNFVNLKAYGQRLADALTAELQAELEIARLSVLMRETIRQKRAALPVEVVHGARSARPTYTERATAYISADVGAIFPRFSTGNWGASLFVGVNFSFAPLDKEVSLSDDGGFGKRFSLIAGITITEFRDNADSVTGIAGGGAAVLGMGLRVTDYLRIGAGGVLFRQKHPNPAIDSMSLRVAPYIAMSVDSDVAGIIKNLLDRGKKNAL